MLKARIVSLLLSIAAVPGSGRAETLLDDNDLKDENGKEYEFSKAARASYDKKHAAKADKDLLKYYVAGELTISNNLVPELNNLKPFLRNGTDGKDRARVAKLAVRYARPLYGYVQNDEFKGPRETSDAADKQKVGADEVVGENGVGKRAIFKKEVPKPAGNKDEDVAKADDQIVRNVWRFVRDLLWPKDAAIGSGVRPRPDDLPPAVWADLRVTDFWKFDRFQAGEIDMGLRMPAKGCDFQSPQAKWGGTCTGDDECKPGKCRPASFACIEAVMFFASLLREVGYPVAYANTIPSKGKNLFDMQTAAAYVYYGGKWNFFDPWEGFDEAKGYIARRGTVVGPYHDFETFRRTTPLTMALFKEFAALVHKNFKDNEKYGKLFFPTGWEAVEKGSKDGAGANNDPIVRMEVRDAEGRGTGWTGEPAPFGTEVPFRAAIPGSSYFDPDTLVTTKMTLDPDETPVPRGDETLFWPFDGPVADTRSYTLRIINPTSTRASYDIDLLVDEVTRTIDLLTPASRRLSGQLDPLESLDVPLVFRFSSPRPQPPAPVARVFVERDRDLRLSWPAAAGAESYVVRECTGTTLPKTPSDLSGCSVRASNLANTTIVLPRPLPGSFFFAVTATNATGESGLDPDEGSVAAVRTACEIDVNADGTADIRLADADGDGLCEWPSGTTTVRGPLVIPAETPIELSGSTTIVADRILVEAGGLVVGEPGPLVKLTLTARASTAGDIVSRGTLDVAVSDDVKLQAAGSIDLRGVTRLAAGDRLTLTATRGDVGIAPPFGDPGGFTLFARNRVDVTARSANGNVDLAAVRVGSPRIVVDTRANVSVVGPKRLTVRDGTILTTDRGATGLSYGSAISLSATGRIVLAGAPVLDATTVVSLLTQRTGDPVCLSHGPRVEAGNGLGSINLTNVRGAVFDDGTAILAGRVLGGDRIAPGECP